MRHLQLVGVVLFTSLLTGCDGGNDIPSPTLQALQNAEHYELLSLNPSREEVKDADDFHGWRVLGRTTVDDAATRKRLTDALRAGARANDGMVAACFNPRHGIRVTRSGTTTDLVICFECMSVKVFGADQAGVQFLTTADPQPTFDDVLGKAGVKLAEGAR